MKSAQKEDVSIETAQKRVQSWVLAKKMIVEKEFEVSDMLMLAKAISPKNALNTCTMGFETIKMDITGENRLVPSVSLELYLPSKECARMLSLCMNGHSLNLPFQASVKLDKAADGLPGYVMTIRSKGEITPRGVHGMIHTINMEQYAKYAVFRAFSNFLARSAVYEFSMEQLPERPLFPTKLPTDALTGKSISDQIVLAEKVFIPANKEIDAIISSGLTAVDLISLKQTFVRGVTQSPEEMLQFASKMDIKSPTPDVKAPDTTVTNSPTRRFGS